MDVLCEFISLPSPIPLRSSHCLRSYGQVLHWGPHHNHRNNAPKIGMVLSGQNNQTIGIIILHLIGNYSDSQIVLPNIAETK